MAKPGDRVNAALAKWGYTLIRKVGEGSFGSAVLVQHASEKDKGTNAIVKMIDISRATRQEKDDAVKESKVLASLKHPYIVRYRETFHEDDWLCIVMDYCEGGDLSDRIKKMRQSGKSFPQEQVLRWFTQCVLALKYIHDRHILHRDLKSGNFFLSKSGNIKMGDFGIAKVLECTAACAQTQIGTPYYLSPEICQGKPYAWGSDIWSMGCILFEMCAKKVPFDAPDLKSLIQRITKGPTPEIPTEYSVGIRMLGKELLDRDPSRRPPAAEVLKKPVVQEVVRKMLDEVKAEEDAAAPPADAPPRAGAPAAAEAGGSAPSGAKYVRDAGSYRKNEVVEYYSETHKEWLPASITNVDAEGRIMLNVKPNVWLSLDVQGSKVRPKQGADQGQPQAAAPGARHASNTPGGARNPSVGAPPRPAAGSDSPGPGARERAARNPSRGGLPPAAAPGAERRGATPTRQAAPPAVPVISAGQRGPSPRPGGGAAGVRQPTPDRAAGRRTPQRRESPSGAGVPSGAAGAPRPF